MDVAVAPGPGVFVTLPNEEGRSAGGGGSQVLKIYKFW